MGSRSAGGGARCVRGGACHRPRRRCRADAAGRAIPAVASRPLRRGAGRRHRSSGTPANCIRRSWSGPGLPKGTCAVELDLDAIPITETLPAPAVSPFPAVFQDVSLIVGEDVAAQTVVDAVRDGAGELLEDVRLFDVYTGPQIGDGPQVADAGAALPRRRPHADRGRGQRGPRRRRARPPPTASARCNGADGSPAVIHFGVERSARRARVRRIRGSTDGQDAVVGKHTGVASDGLQFGVVAVGVNLEQVAALWVPHPHTE